MITFRPAQDLAGAARLTLANMRPYYEQYAVDWDAPEIEKLTKVLINWDIVREGETVGVIRLSLDSEGCHLRDLQVDPRYQNLGIGTQAIAEVERFAKESGALTLRLKVFKLSPAFNLYTRQGFRVSDEDERFYYMSRAVS